MNCRRKRGKMLAKEKRSKTWLKKEILKKDRGGLKEKKGKNASKKRSKTQINKKMSKKDRQGVKEKRGKKASKRKEDQDTDQ